MMCIKDEEKKLPTVSAERRNNTNTAAQCNVWLGKIKGKRTRTSGKPNGNDDRH